MGGLRPTRRVNWQLDFLHCQLPLRIAGGTGNFSSAMSCDVDPAMSADPSVRAAAVWAPFMCLAGLIEGQDGIAHAIDVSEAWRVAPCTRAQNADGA